MIYSRSPEQYDKTPWLDPFGNRFSSLDAPRNSKWAPRLSSVPTRDKTPMLNLTTGDSIELEAYEKLKEISPFSAAQYVWAPRDDRDKPYNLILASIRKIVASPEKRRNIMREWIETIEDKSEYLIGLNPLLSMNALTEAKIVLQRILNISQQGETTHA